MAQAAAVENPYTCGGASLLLAAAAAVAATKTRARPITAMVGQVSVATVEKFCQDRLCAGSGAPMHDEVYEVYEARVLLNWTACYAAGTAVRGMTSRLVHWL